MPISQQDSPDHGPGQSLEALQDAVALRPGDVEAAARLAHRLLEAKKWGQAVRAYRNLLKLAPEREDARQGAAKVARFYKTLGDSFLKKGDRVNAVSAYEAVITVLPAFDVESHLRLASALHGLEKYDRALAVLRRASQLFPGHVEPHIRAGNILVDLQRRTGALAAYRKAVETNPQSVRACRYLTDALIKEGHLAEALTLARELRSMLRDEPNSIGDEANVLELMGNVREGYELLRPVIERGHCTPHVAITFGKICQRLDPPSDEAVVVLEQALNGELLPDMRARVLHTLAGLCNALKRFDEAFPYLHQAKAIEASRFEDSRDELLSVIDRSRTCFTRERLARLPRASNGSDLPLFIVGMPRSGTSLAEQILSSHPLVFGADELTTIISLARTALGKRMAYPECLDHWDQATVDRAAGVYLRQLRDLAPDAARVTDKMPFNFLHLGMIEVLFPNARIIHCSRNPLDTCVSCYFMEFSPKLSIFNDLETTGRYYRGYHELMRHWRQVLSLPLFELNYETLLAEPERMVRDLVAFCGLEWNDACMKFHETQRHVKTFSYHQVRKPLYTQSMGRYRAYEHHLEPLKKGLGEDIMRTLTAPAE